MMGMASSDLRRRRFREDPAPRNGTHRRLVVLQDIAAVRGPLKR